MTKKTKKVERVERADGLDKAPKAKRLHKIAAYLYEGAGTFSWVTTPQGFEYWKKVADNLNTLADLIEQQKKEK